VTSYYTGLYRAFILSEKYILPLLVGSLIVVTQLYQPANQAAKQEVTKIFVG
jgi:hypothetical protein